MGAFKVPARERPGCITAFALLYWVSGAFYVIGAITTGVILMASGEDTAIWGLLTMFCMGLFAFLPIGLGIGLWQMKKWAWWVVVVLQGIGLLGVVGNLCLVTVAENIAMAVTTVISSLIGGAINGGVLYWFYMHQGLFEPSYFRDKEGKVYNRPVKGKDSGIAIAIVVGAGAILCLMPIVIIAVLTLMGPQIGNVFSQIIIDLEA